ncbi:hypothetical protein T459_02899 [Capsicum annuum]|uniref:Reverse transcriptase Ty1/copia-type domain-containing protein n=1 Tax=Capsicum annuum TaxID=4072 RepID=A0A2G3AL93_CAPAN|nr:hypothetical protein FXO37_34295 [Capsicum annuum]PHT95017.1 hypothetical protein T459_02899 [Capsicum annuum]
MGLTGAKPFKTPLEVKVKLTTLEFDQHVDSDALLDDPGEYQRMVGRLLYLTIIRPDIAFVVQRPSQFMRSSKMSHMHATLVPIIDSISGYLLKFRDSILSWKSKKQSTIFRSSTEAEYNNLASTVTEVVWVSNLLTELVVRHTTPVPMLCDNKFAIQIATKPVFHE